MMSNVLKHELRQYEETSVDIEDLLHNAHNLIRLSQPFIYIIQCLHAIQRWEPWWLCLLLLCVCNFVCYMFEGYLIVFSLSTVLFLAGLGYAHHKTNILAKIIPPNYVENDSPRMTADENVVNFDQEKDLAQSELVEEFRLLLCLVHDVMNGLTHSILQIFSVLKWRDVHTSLKWYTLVLILTVLLHTIPSHYVIMLTVNGLLLHYPIYQYFLVLKGIQGTCVPQQSKDYCLNTDDSDQDANPEPPGVVFDIADTQEGVEMYDAKMADSDNIEEDEKSEGGSSSDELGVVEIKVGASNTSLSSGGCSDTNSIGKNKRQGVVGKILKTVKNQTSSGSCEGCKVNFTTILKRRRLCSHCGNHFCARCCSYKVTRSMFGATAPAAQTETVSVCFYCFTYLNKIIYTKLNGESRVNPQETNGASANSPKDKSQ